jgi:outer membrane protein OmpA-like peptidoglycan-associated protein
VINGIAEAILGEQAVRFFVADEPSATDSYRYLAARRDVDGEHTTVALLIAQNENPDRGAKMALLTIDSGAMETGKIVVPTVEALEQGLARDGRYALYGLFFDTGRAILKPDSQPTLEAIAGLLRAQPGLAIIVAGHTDNQGEFQFNITLSQQRAAAVVAALTRTYGIAASRLTPFGAGMSAPAASNADEAGRAKNRRVEIVSR